MRTTAIRIGAVLGFAVALVACLSVPAMSQEDGVLRVAVSLPDLVPIVRTLGGDAVEIVGILPPGGDPRSFELGPEASAHAEGSDLIVFANSDVFDFEKKLKETGEGIDSVDWPDYERHGAALKDFPNAEASPYGFWMGFENAEAIAAAIAEALMAHGLDAEAVAGNLASFLTEINAMEASGRELMKAIGGEEKAWVGAVPDVGYVIDNLGLAVGEIIQEEAEGTTSGGRLQDIESRLRAGTCVGLVCPLSMRETKAGETCEQVARATGAPVCYVHLLDTEADGSYVAQAAYNAAALSAASSSRTPAPVERSRNPAGLIWGLVAFALLILLAIQNRRMHALASGAALGSGPFEKKGKKKKGKK